MKNLLLLILVIVLGLGAAIGIYLYSQRTKENLTLKHEIGKTWVQIIPVQCLGNPWEQDWLENNNNDYPAYPRNTKAVELNSAEIKIIKDYYQKQGVIVYDLKTQEMESVTCEACSCPQGYVLYLLISDSNLDWMLEQGFELTSTQTN